jgi:hypothetical protein
MDAGVGNWTLGGDDDQTAGAAEAAAVLAAVIRPRHYVFGCVLFASYRFRRRDFVRAGRQI